MDSLDETELQNPFPSPPSHYTTYTTHNLNLLEKLKEKCDDIHTIDLDEQTRLLEGEKDPPDFLLAQLEKPRVDWILKEPDGYYDVFGDRWFVKEKFASLDESGIRQFYPKDPTVDRRPDLKNVLQSLLVTYSRLTKSLLDPPPAYPTEEAPEWYKEIEWLSILSQNLTAAANDLRPVQARMNLEDMMNTQLRIRKEETASIHEKCNALEGTLAMLRQSAKTDQPQDEEMDSVVKTTDVQSSIVDDTQLWAEEIS